MAEENPRCPFCNFFYGFRISELTHLRNLRICDSEIPVRICGFADKQNCVANSVVQNRISGRPSQVK